MLLKYVKILENYFEKKCATIHEITYLFRKVYSRFLTQSAFLCIYKSSPNQSLGNHMN